MEDRFELPASVRVGKNEPRQFVAAQLAVRTEDFRSESGHNVGQRGLAGLDNLAR